MGNLNNLDWATHGIVMGVLAAIGVVFTVVDRLGASGGGFLRGMVSVLVWIGLAIAAAVFTLTFALLSPYVGMVPSYLAALPILAAGWFVPRRLKERKWNRLCERQQVELSSRFELLSWSPETPGPGRLILRAEIRPLKDLMVRFHGEGRDGAGGFALLFEELKPVAAKAGETARFQLEIKVTPDRPMVDYELEFWTWTGNIAGGASQGVISYEKIDADLQDGPSRLRRPLPPPRPSAA